MQPKVVLRFNPPELKSIPSVAQEGDAFKSQDFGMVKKLWPYAKPYTAWFLLAFVCMPVSAWVVSTFPVWIQRAMLASVEDKPAVLWEAVKGYSLFVLLDWAVRITQMFSLQWAGQKSLLQLRLDLFARLEHIRMSYFDVTPSGRIVTRITNDVDALSELFSSGAVTVWGDAMLLLVLLWRMFQMDVTLTWMVLMVMPFLVFVLNVLRKSMRVVYREIRTVIAQLNAYLAEQVSGTRVVRSYQKEQACADEFAYLNHLHREANHRSIKLDAQIYSLVESVVLICLTLLLVYGVTADKNTAVTASLLMAFSELLQRFFIPIRELSQKFALLQGSMAALERLNAYLAEPLETVGTQNTDAVATWDLSSAPILVNHVSFAYKEGLPILKDIHFTLKPEERVAFVGPSGTGKTTLFSLLLRFYETKVGQILVFGREVSAQKQKEVCTALVQEPYLFSGTLKDNIIMEHAWDESRMEEVMQALDGKLLEREGLERVVEERGANLSGGEKQLVSIARALYAPTPIILLDEPTSSVDSVTEQTIEKALSILFKGRTVLTIAHRLSTVRNMDRIFVMNKGSIVEEGNHDTLMAKQGTYFKLVEMTRLKQEIQSG